MDRPKLLQEPEALKHRLSLLGEEHIAPLTSFVEQLREITNSSAIIPYFDPWDGGIYAEALFLLEAPGAKARNSGFVSMNNPDETAKNFFEISQEAGFNRKQIITWNTVPWYIGSDNKIRPANSNDISEGIKSLGELLELLTNLRVIILVGKKAQKAKLHIQQLAPNVKIFCSPHPSPLYINNSPNNRDKLLNIWQSVQHCLQRQPKIDTSNRNDLDLQLLRIAKGVEGLFIHFQPKKGNRRWGFRRKDFNTRSTAWIEPKTNSNEFAVKPTGDFRRFKDQLESVAERVKQDQSRSVYYFKYKDTKKVFNLLQA